MSTKLHQSEDVNMVDNSIPWLTFLIDCVCVWGGGVKILECKILTPSNKYSSKYPAESNHSFALSFQPFIGL